MSNCYGPRRDPPALTRQRLPGAAGLRPAGHSCASSAPRGGSAPLPLKLHWRLAGATRAAGVLFESRRGFCSFGRCAAGAEKHSEGLPLKRTLGFYVTFSVSCVVLFQAAVRYLPVKISPSR